MFIFTFVASSHSDPAEFRGENGDFNTIHSIKATLVFWWISSFPFRKRRPHELAADWSIRPRRRGPVLCPACV